MLRRRNRRRLLLPVLLCMLFCGCTPFYAVSELLSPPQFSAENAALRKAFEATAGKNVQYRSPVSGENLSAFLLEDLDADGEREALVFYSPDSLDGTVHIGVLEQTGGVWLSVQDVACSGIDVFSAETLDMDCDGQTELIVCFGMPDGSRLMSVFSCAAHPFSLIKLSDNGYTAKRCADLNGDGQTEIFTIFLYPDAGGQTAQARVLQKTQTGVSTVDKCFLDGKVTGYGDIFPCPTDTGCVLFADAYRGDSEMLTEVIVWDRESMTMHAPLLDGQTHSNTKTVRYTRVASCDIDGDGMPEIPRQPSEFRHGEIVRNGVAAASPMYLTEWCAFRGDDLEPIQQSLVHTDGKCMFNVPQDWTDKFSVVSDPDKGQWDFYSIDPRTDERVVYLFTALFTTRAQWAKQRDKLQDYTPLLTAGEDMLVVYGINTESPLYLSEAMLKNAFMMLR